MEETCPSHRDMLSPFRRRRPTFLLTGLGLDAGAYRLVRPAQPVQQSAAEYRRLADEAAANRDLRAGYLELARRAEQTPSRVVRYVDPTDPLPCGSITGIYC